jgi:hygromycin-B 7''-O-kinase
MPDPDAPAARPPDHPTPELIDAILARHNLSRRAVVPLGNASAGSRIYLLGDDLVLRVPHEQPDNVHNLQAALTASNAAREAGVRTPRILLIDDTRDLLPVPYAILERVPGEPLSKHSPAPDLFARAWRDVGHDLALLHSRVSADGPAGALPTHDMRIDPRPWLEELVAGGLVFGEEAEWLSRWLDALQETVWNDVPTAFCHGDMNGDNVLVHPGTFDYLAIVDWDGAGWMDPAWDFVPAPISAVPWLLEGYREVAEVPGQTTAEARILWHHVQYAIFIWWRKQPQGRPLVEQGLARLRRGIATLLELPGARWLAHRA